MNSKLQCNVSNTLYGTSVKLNKLNLSPTGTPKDWNGALMLDNAVYSGRMGADLDRADDWELESVISLSPAIHALVMCLKVRGQSQPL